jgi:hypothetical protein
MLKLIRENERARIQLVVCIARDGEPGVHYADVSACTSLMTKSSRYNQGRSGMAF